VTVPASRTRLGDSSTGRTRLGDSARDSTRRLAVLSELEFQSASFGPAPSWPGGGPAGVLRFVYVARCGLNGVLSSGTMATFSVT
jgi:hypothetical protein